MTEAMVLVLSTSREENPARRALERAILDAIGRRAAPPVLITPHVYDLVPEGPVAEALRAVSAHLVVLGWISPRAMHGTLAQLGMAGEPGCLAPLSPPPSSSSNRRTIWCVDLREEADASACLDRLAPLWAGFPLWTKPVPPRQLEEETRPRWYPVIDGRRCRRCLECLNFCLFGVYSVNEAGTVQVEQPDACRPGCPACARVCPAGAIMFPQHDEPVIAGAADKPLEQSQKSHSPQDQDLDALVDDVDNLPP